MIRHRGRATTDHPAIPFILAATRNGRWTPGIGDPTVIGWATVAAYVVTALLCGWALVRCGPDDGWRIRLYWAVPALGLLLLGINKQLDLQTWFTQAARDHAKAQGWYPHRRTYQFWFIVGLGVLSACALLVALWVIRARWRALWLPTLGMALLIVFIPARAATMHHVDRLLGLRLVGLSVNGVFEIGSITLIAIGALIFRGKHGRAKHGGA